MKILKLLLGSFLGTSICTFVLLSAFIYNVNGQQPRGETYRGPQYYSGGQQQIYYPQNDNARQKVSQNPQAAFQNQQQTFQPQYYQNQQPVAYQNTQQSYPQQNYPQQNYQNPQQKYPSQQNYQKPSYTVNQQQPIRQPSQTNYQTVKPLNYNQQSQKPSNLSPSLDTRFGAGDDPSAYNNNFEITSRQPPTKVGVKPSKPAAVPPRFDDINNRKLTWDEELTHNAEKFALYLFAYLANSETENFMISPQSIHNLLDLIAEGASGNTYTELNQTLGLINRQRTRDFHQYSNLALK